MSLLSEAAGEYRLEIKASDGKALSGRYLVAIKELRAAMPEDQIRVEAEKIHANAEQLYWRQTADARREAIGQYAAALDLWRAVPADAEEAQAVFRLGQISTASGRYREALEYFGQALGLRRTIGDRFGEGGVLQFTGETYFYLGEYPKALEYYDQALTVRREIGDQGGEAYALQDIGLVHLLLGDAQKALEYFDLAFPLWRAVGDRRGEGLGYHNAAGAWNHLGDFQRTLDYYDRALKLRREADDRQGEAQTLSNIGSHYLTLGQNQLAQEFFNRALPLRRRVGDRRGEAYTLLNIGRAQLESGDRRLALDNFTQSLSISRAIGDRDAQSRALMRIGETYARRGELTNARDFSDQALELIRTVGDRPGEAEILAILGDVYRKMGQHQNATEYFASALAIERRIRYGFGEAKTLVGLAHVQRDAGRLAEAAADLEAAVDLIESERATLAFSDLRASFLGSAQNAYETYIDVLMQLHRLEPSAGHAASALLVAERARARSFLEMLSEARVDVRQGTDVGLLDREQRLRQQLNLKAEQLTRLLGGNHLEQEAADATREVDALLGELKKLEAQIRTSSPHYATLTHLAPLSLAEIQQQVVDDQSVLLEYALGEERSYLWAITTTSIASFELPARGEIEAAARRAYELLTLSHRREAKNQAHVAAARLSDILLGPVSNQLGGKRLLIAADGALQYVPFAALPIPKGSSTRVGFSERSPEPLVVRHEIVSLPSSSSLAALRRELRGHQPAPRAVAVLADPVLDAADPRVKSSTRVEAHTASDSSASGSAEDNTLTSDLMRSAIRSAVAGLERLRFTRREAEGILEAAGKAQTLKALDFNASRETAISPDLGQYRIVHFATHGLLNNEHPELSGIVLSLVGPQGQPVDGFLRLHDIYNLKLGADLVVLSACRTALGQEIKGEGLISVTRGFMYAGAPRVVASLWDVRDEATSELMKRFYGRMLRQGLSPAAALRAAQVSMWREPRWEAPYYWAAFLLQGEWR